MAIAALAIGIGSATAIFTVVQTVMLKPLPYAQDDRWVAILGGSTADSEHFSGLSWAECKAYQAGLVNFELVGWFPVGGDFNLTPAGRGQAFALHVSGIEVSPALLAQSGARPLTGRVFTGSDGEHVAVVSRRLLAQLGSGIIGNAVRLNGESYTVVGAMPGWFRLPVVTVYSRNSDNDIWIPLKPPQDEDHARNYAAYQIYAKLSPGVSFNQGKAEAVRLAAQIRLQFHPNDPTYTAGFLSLRETVVQTVRPVLYLLLAAAGLLLLITCANVAGLLVSRSVGRARETAVRIALGGSQMQLATQYFLESLWLALAAALGGVLLTMLLVKMLLTLAADYIPRSNEVAVDSQAAAFALLLGFLTATLSAVAPLWQAFRTPPREVLNDGVRASADARSRWLSKALVIGEITLAFTLISAGALLLWEFRSLTETSPGFNPTGLLTFQITRPNPGDFCRSAGGGAGGDTGRHGRGGGKPDPFGGLLLFNVSISGRPRCGKRSA